MIQFVCGCLVLISSAAIVYQDFRTRLISLWLIVVFGAAAFVQFLVVHSYKELFENGLFCAFYFLFCYLVLMLFYFLKTGKFQRLLDTKIGWGDVWLLLIAGCCLPPVQMPLFFTVTFVITIVFHLLFARGGTIPLGAFLMVCFDLWIFLVSGL